MTCHLVDKDREDLLCWVTRGRGVTVRRPDGAGEIVRDRVFSPVAPDGPIRRRISGKQRRQMSTILFKNLYQYIS